MIQQPKLGKEIAHRRKTAGLTQEKLAEKCFINVRSLQRIESGEATPRAYTLKSISEALNYKFEDSPNEKRNSNWPNGQRRNYFNLEVKSLKTASIFILTIIVIVLGVFIVKQNYGELSMDATQHKTNDIRNSVKYNIDFSNFSCDGCIEDNQFIIGRDVSFKLGNASFKNIRLIYLDKKTREFNTSFIKGAFLDHKVEVECSKDLLIGGNIKYSGDQIEELKDGILVLGNAKVYEANDIKNLNDDQIIQSDEILIKYKKDIEPIHQY